MKKLLTILLVAGFTGTSFAQTALTQYNMRLIHQSGLSNPSFTPGCKVNVDGILFASTTFASSNTGFSRAGLNNFTQGPDGVVKTLNKMGNISYFDLDFRRELIHFGFRVKDKHYLGFNASLRSNTTLTYAKDFATFLFLGNGISPDDPDVAGIPSEYMLLGKRASFDESGIDHQTYLEFGLQYAVKLLEDDKLGIGIRPKFLVGLANVQTAESRLGLTTDATTFGLTLDGSYLVNTSIPWDSLTESPVSPGLNNKGFGIDLGASFKPIKELEISASLLDLGRINWNFQTVNYQATDGNLEFRGFPIDGSIFDLGQNTDSLMSDFTAAMEDSLNTQFGAAITEDSYKTKLATQFNFGVNYTFKERHNVGALFNARKPKDHLRAAFNLNYAYQVDKRLSLHVNYSAYNRSYANFGLGLSVKAGPFQAYAMSDNALGTAFGILAPGTTKNRHATFGLNWVFGCVDDKDKDGILDKDDLCPTEPGELRFKGCPDTDKDGVPDKDDLCPETPGAKEYNGCPDRDGDGIVDKEDACPDAPGVAEFNGCPDTDKDGIKDEDDACPTTAGIAQFNGCPDTDKDGIQDSEDACPDKAGIVAFNGCPDTDNDGIQDSEDACPEKAGSKEMQGCPDTDKDGLADHKDDCPEVAGPVNNRGCPFGDRDGDGVIDNEDSCPDTPGPVENAGCPYSDLDGDGVYDKDDRCPQTPGLASNQGCPEIKKEEQEVLNTAFDNLEFETGKDIIRPSSFESLDKLAELLVKKPDWRLQISGHTDNVGSDASNLVISEKRAKAVSKYLQSKGVAEGRLVVKWFGESQPIADNDTPEGRAKNRRVEMEVIFD